MLRKAGIHKEEEEEIYVKGLCDQLGSWKHLFCKKNCYPDIT